MPQTLNQFTRDELDAFVVCFNWSSYDLEGHRIFDLGNPGKIEEGARTLAKALRNLHHLHFYQWKEEIARLVPTPVWDKAVEIDPENSRLLETLEHRNATVAQINMPVRSRRRVA